MTLREAIAICDATKPNQYTVQEKIRWLSGLDGRIKGEILAGYAISLPDFAGYSEEDIDRPLLVAAPYDRIYPHYLQAQVDYYNAEYGRYNNSVEVFNEIYQAFGAYISRTKAPVGATNITVG